ncbi:hypothetical protein MAR_005798 [Mya arenaria]|uniref:Uncharacterized protein n=1 Tax=Mya arenaria TaxID=6604 RepID=A0ABY7F0I8_MYAAR|nr:hypothetical protein MAR_005798 [Mya arenaria]
MLNVQLDHVERAIAEVKNFKNLTNRINLSLFSKSNMFTINHIPDLANKSKDVYVCQMIPSMEEAFGHRTNHGLASRVFLIIPASGNEIHVSLPKFGRIAWGVQSILLTTITSWSGGYDINVTSNVHRFLKQAVPDFIVISLRLKE